VSAVVLYHAGLGGAGYVGVDVFFVISGYLITALLLREQAADGRIDLADFYARRVRRIFPACLVVVLAVLVAAALWLPKPAPVFQSAAASALFVSNVFFQVTTSGYFHDDAAQMPLLHLWSLSVEEQFYLLWPALLAVLLRLRVRLAPVLAVLAIASLLLSEWWLQSNPSAAFYQMPARFWELAVGGLVAVSAPRARGSAWMLVGLALVLAACVVPLARFPGVGALPAVVGSALVLAAVHGGAGNAWLGSRPMVGIGLVSYSLYLWHWPLLAFARALRIGETPAGLRLLLVACALLLAIATYFFVETPLRRRRWTSRRTVFVGAVSMLALGCGAWAAHPLDPPVAPAPAVLAAKCVRAPIGAMFGRDCLGARPRVVVWGDSFAHSWTPLVQVLSVARGVPATSLALDGCPPLPGARLSLRGPKEAADCAVWNREALAYLQAHPVDTLVLAARWHYFMQEGDGNGAAAALREAVATLAPHVGRIVVIGPSPEFVDTPEKCRALGQVCVTSRAAFEAQAATSWRALRALEAEPKVSVLAPADWLCQSGECPAFRDGDALYSDQAHPSNSAASGYGRFLYAVD
jgi:peptidoglycan/LPS O-acetylase OafA/YrhL